MEDKDSQKAITELDMPFLHDGHIASRESELPFAGGADEDEAGVDAVEDEGCEEDEAKPKITGTRVFNLKKIRIRQRRTTQTLVDTAQPTNVNT